MRRIRRLSKNAKENFEFDREERYNHCARLYTAFRYTCFVIKAPPVRTTAGPRGVFSPSALPVGAYTMLYYVHNPRGNIVIRTNNPLIAVQHQKSGWLTATSLDELLSEHPERQPSPSPPSAWRKATELISRACGSVLASFSPTLALAQSYTPSGAAAMMSLLNNSEGASRDGSAPAARVGAIAIGRLRNGGSSGNAPGTEPAGTAHNSAPLSWKTALECRLVGWSALRAIVWSDISFCSASGTLEKILDIFLRPLQFCSYIEVVAGTRLARPSSP